MSVPFQSVAVVRTDINTGLTDGGVWFLDDVRYVVATPEPHMLLYYAQCRSDCRSEAMVGS
jgi:hypothetical protein